MEELLSKSSEELNNQDLNTIIHIFDENNQNFDKDIILRLRDFIHQQGFQFALQLATIAVQSNIHPNAKYLIFSNLSKFLHPRAQPVFLSNIINQFIPIITRETSKLSKISLCRCVSNAFYHIVSAENVQNFESIIQTLGNDSIIFLSELITVLKCAIDIPMLASKNFNIIVNILPPLLPTIIGCFYSDPDVSTYDILSFYMTTLKEEPLRQLLIKMNSNFEFNVEGFVQQIRIIFNDKIPFLINAFENPLLNDSRYNSYLCHLLDFFSDVVLYGIDPANIESVVHSIFKVQINVENIECFCSMIKAVFKHQLKLLNVGSLNFLFEMTFEMAKQFNLEGLNSLLSLISNFYATIMEMPGSEIPPQMFLDLVQRIIPFLIRHYPVDQQQEVVGPPIQIISLKDGTPVNQKNDEEEESKDEFNEDEYMENLEFRDNIIDMIASLCSLNPLPSTELIEQIFYGYQKDGQADCYICEWVLSLLNQYIQYAEQTGVGDNIIGAISRVTVNIINNPLIHQYANSYPSIALIICQVFRYVDNKEMGLFAFRLAIAQFASNDDVMEEVFSLARKYKFALLNEIPPDSCLSSKILITLSTLSPSNDILARANQLIHSGEISKMQEATSLIYGLQKSEFEFDSMPFIIELSNHELFAEALKISHANPDACMHIIDLASQCVFEEDVFDRIVLNALRAAKAVHFAPLTEKVLAYLNIDRPLSFKIIENIYELFSCHIEAFLRNDPGSNVTDQSLFILLRLSKKILVNSIMVETIVSKIVRCFIFFFNRILPMLDQEYWSIIFHAYLYNDMSGTDPDAYDLMFQFSMVNFELYRSLMLSILAEVTDNGEELLAFLHNGIDQDNPNRRLIYKDRFICVYKAFVYYKHFT